MVFDFSRPVAGRAWRAAGKFITKLDTARAAKRLIVIPAILTAAGLAIAQTAGPIPSTNLVSVSSGGYAGNIDSWRSAISADGRFVAFDSLADNLVAGDTNGQFDVYVHDYQNGTTERVSLLNGGQPMADGVAPSISADGRYVAFVSTDATLLPGGENPLLNLHAYLHDRQTGSTELLDVDDSGGVGDSSGVPFSVSADGRYVVIISASTNLVPDDTNSLEDIFVRDRQTGTIERVNVSDSGEQANGYTGLAAISGDGRFVAFVSTASNLVPGDTNGREDVFVRDRLNGTTARVNVNNAGEQAQHSYDTGGLAGTYGSVAISADGRYVAFDSYASNLDPADTDEDFDVFVRDTQSGTTELISVDSTGGSGGGAGPFISADGRYVVFQSGDTIIPGVSSGVFIRDRLAGTTGLVSVDNSGTPLPSNSGSAYTPISGNGQFVAFASNASQLIPSDAEFPPRQLFVRNRGPHDGQTPSVAAGGPYSVNAGESVTLAATGFDPNGDPLTYAWDFDNDGVFETAGQSVVFPTTGFTRSANYNVRVRVTNATGLTGTASAVVAITATNVAPNVSAGGPYAVDEGGSVMLSATGSDANNDPLTYVWDLDNNGTFETPGQTATFSAAGLDGPTARNVSVQVTDSGGLTATASATITINNVAPAADAGGPYAVNEGAAVTVSATGTDPSSADAAALTYAWDLDNNGSFETLGQTASFSAMNIDGPAVVSVRVQVSDKDGGVSVDTATVSVANAAPVASAGGPYTVDEGGSITLTASAADVAADALTFAWDLDNDGTFETPGQSVTFSAANLDGPATLIVRVQVTDDDGGVAIASANVTVDNVAPSVSAITAPVDPMPIGTPFSAAATFSDPAAADTHTAAWIWDYNISTVGVVSGNTVTGSYTYTNAGIRQIELRVSDGDGGTGTSLFSYAVSYDPTDGVVTGGGTINSPIGAYMANPAATGPANLGFVSNIPRKMVGQVGAVAFRLDPAEINFRSNTMNAPVISHARAQITGTGTFNGISGYSFLLAVVDGQVKGGGGVDRYRIKIWNAAGVVYDNEPGAADDADPVTPLQSGSIIVQKTGAKGS